MIPERIKAKVSMSWYHFAALINIHTLYVTYMNKTYLMVFAIHSNCHAFKQAGEYIQDLEK